MEKHSLNGTLIIFNAFNLILLGVLLRSGMQLFPVLLIMLLSTSLVQFLTFRLLNRQYREIKDITEKVSMGDHSQRVPTLNVEEFNELGLSINKMLGRLDSTIGHLAIHREELRLIVGTIQDALWSINSEGKIEWANTAFAELFDLYDETRMQYYWEVIREVSLLSYIREFDSSSEHRIQEISLAGHTYLLSGSQNPDAQRMVLLMQNIDDIHRAEQMKKDFIVNLAHELRTPLTAIKGFSEAMEETADQQNMRYLKIIKNHTNRLINLINDLQTLIRLEQNYSINLQEIDLVTFFDNIKLILDPLFEDKDVELKVDIDPTHPRFCVDPFKFEQIFINLVENSLRYTERGQILIKGKATESDLTITINDNGSGIAPEHLPRIFERFYVADPSRNRNSSGTGLGLAIVKHIVVLHKGTIEVDSTLGVGTTFKIVIPANNAS
ncbi:MAG: HAMP domain-containing sensor histidine kinase [Candidatus Cloacimonadaceae bacterium]|jgi:two-component system phosphate regulon sensor histidine kinase PhoR